MKFSAAIAAGILSASVVTAAPGTAARRARRAERLAKRDSSVQKMTRPMIKPTNVTAEIQSLNGEKHPEYSTNWAGAVLIGSGYTGVTGTFTIPSLSLPSGGSRSTEYSASAWVGIDGDTCETAILQTGVDFTLYEGESSYDAWYEWYPDYAYDFSGISFSEGDVVTVTVTATSDTSGSATVENTSTGETVTHTFSNVDDGSLCETNAEWIVEDYTEIYSNGEEELVPLVDWGTVTFSDCSATTSSGTVTPADATIIDMVNEQGTEVETDCSVSGSTVTCEYV